ncbi:MAG: hypothetical protein ACI8Y4_004164 [Candidatus Poriferisodalaceae bacterium]
MSLAELSPPDSQRSDQHRLYSNTELPDDTSHDAFRLLARDIDNVIQGGAPVEFVYLQLGDDVVELRFVGIGARAPFTRALAHLVRAPTTTPSFQLDVCTPAVVGTGLSPLLRVLLESVGTGGLSPRFEIPALTNDRVRTISLPWDGMLAMYSAQHCRAQVWIEEPSTLPIWDHGAPFRTIFNWWLSDSGRYCIHAGAVGTSDGAVLLTGKGGSGKSTSSLACVGSELGYLSDDYCVLDVDGTPEVLSLYNTGKLNGQVDLDRQPRFARWIVNGDRLGEEKQLMYIHEHQPEAIVRRAPLRAVILPKVTGRVMPELSRITGGAALRALAPTSLFQLPGSGAQALARMAALVQRLPCYQMETGNDLAAIPATLAHLLKSLNRGLPAPESLNLDASKE